MPAVGISAVREPLDGRQVYLDNGPMEAVSSAEFPDRKRRIELTGRITAEPNPLAAETSGPLVLSWEVDGDSAEVRVSADEAPEQVVARGPRATMPVDWVQAGRIYAFRLYGGENLDALLDEVTVTREVAGSITASPNPVPWTADSKTLLQWEITAPLVAEIYLLENGSEEKLVCRGPSGSFEVGGLLLGCEYRFRLYLPGQPRTLLREACVKLEEIPWMALLDRCRTAPRSHLYSDEFARFIAGVLPGALRQESFAQWYRLWEASGFHITRNHFYEPIPDSRNLKPELWSQPHSLPGVEMNDPTQRHFLNSIVPRFQTELESLPLDAPTAESPFYLRNGRFEGIDPLLAHCVVRHFRPRQIVEVGSGYSTLLLAQAALQNGDCAVHSIEPYPEEFLTRGVKGLTSLLEAKVEEVDPAFFDRLESGDILFIDSSHVVRIGGDVNFLFLQVLPRLRPGVIVHVHDIFLPYEYQSKWVFELRRFWTEQYLLQAFLAFNSDFEVLVSTGHLKAHYFEQVQETFPTAAPWRGGSFWMRRKPAPF